MNPVSATVTVDAPRERVFDLLGDLDGRPAFTDHFQLDYRPLRLESRGVGAGARFRVPMPRMPVWMETVIEELEPPHLIGERGRGGRSDRIPNRTVWELVEGPGASVTEVTVTFWTEPANHLDRMRERLGARRWLRRQWSRALHRLRDEAEGGGPVERVHVAGRDRVPT